MQPSDEPRRAPLTGIRVGRYVLGERLGTGGAASVYMALLRGPHDFERLVALKVVHEHLMTSPDFVNMFLDEANVAVRLTHPNIVHSYELGREGGHLFLAMEYLAGQPLSSVIERAREQGERLPPGVVAWIGARAAEGLGYAHTFTDESGKRLGLVHRDVSPQNVFLTYDGRVLVIDWGIARAEGRLTHTGLGRIKGKFRYMAPEQMLKHEVDHRADLFALGATLYEAAVGERPFENVGEEEAVAMLLDERAPSPESRVSGFPADLSKTLLRALEREPSARYADAGEMARALDRCVDSGSTAKPAAATVELLSRLFAGEREIQTQCAVSLRSTPRPRIARSPVGATTTADSMASTVRPTPPRRRPRWMLAMAAAAALVAATLALGLARRERDLTPPQPMAAAPAKAVAFEVQVEPAVEATILVDGRQTTGPKVIVPRATAPVDIEVTAPGFEPAHVRAVPDRDQLLSVHLMPRPPEPAASATPVAPSPKGRTAPKAHAATGAQQKKDSLVTEYPF
jgi:serine/threonine protein kinase